MSVIPYSGSNNNQSIVLHDPVSGAVVLFDRDSRQLSLRRDLSVISRDRLNDDELTALERSPSPSSSSHVQFVPRGPSTLSAGPSQQAHFPEGPESCPYCGQDLPSIPERVSPNQAATGSSSRGIKGSNRYFSGGDGRPYVDYRYFKLLNSVGSAERSQSASRQQRSGISASAYSEGYFERFFVTERELGRGGRGAVYLVEHVLDGVSLGHFACKKIPVGDDHKWLERVLREVDLLRLSHSNLVNYNHVWLENATLTNFGPSVPCVFILQEYCNGGTLEEYVNMRSGLRKKDLTVAERKARARRSSRRQSESKSKQEYLSVEEIGSFFADITAALNHLHLNGFVHRDLKPSNCLLKLSSNSPGALPCVMVSDFGEGQREGAQRDATGATGTLGYSAPETLTPNRITGKLSEFSFKTDMFSVGMILYFLCFSSLPYSHDFDSEFADLREEVMRWRGLELAKTVGVRNDLPGVLYEFLTRLLSPVAEDRPSAEELLDLIGFTTEPRRRKSSSGTSVTGSSTSVWNLPTSSGSLAPMNISMRTDSYDESPFVPEFIRPPLNTTDTHASSEKDTTSEDLIPFSAETDAAHMSIFKPEYGEPSAFPIRPFVRDSRTLFFRWVLSYLIVAIVSCFATMLTMNRRARSQHNAVSFSEISEEGHYRIW